jgi:hypothetical protein
MWNRPSNAPALLFSYCLRLHTFLRNCLELLTDEHMFLGADDIVSLQSQVAELQRAIAHHERVLG